MFRHMARALLQICNIEVSFLNFQSKPKPPFEKTDVYALEMRARIISFGILQKQ